MPSFTRTDTHTHTCTQTHLCVHIYTHITDAQLYTHRRSYWKTLWYLEGHFCFGTCTMSHPYVCRDLSICVIWLIHMSSYLQRHDTSKATSILVCVPCRMHTYAVTCPFVCHDSFICTQRLMHLLGMTHSFVSSGSFICLRICNVMTPPKPLLFWFVYHVACICMQRLIHLCVTTQPYVRGDSCICMTWLIHLCHLTHSYVFLFATSWHLQSHFYLGVFYFGVCTMSHAMTHSFVSSDSFICLPICVIRLIRRTHS